ncbi:MAG TPA: M56 family metallopeptidase [Verrucomicrobiae bacterium]
MLWQSSLLIALVFALDLLLAHKLRAAVRYALWFAVLMKLLLPPTLALPTGAAWWLIQNKPIAEIPPVKFTVTSGVSEPLPEFNSHNVVPVARPALNGAGCALLISASASAGLLLVLLIRWRQMNAKVRKATEGETLAEDFKAAMEVSGVRSRVRLKMVEDCTSPAVCGLFMPVILLPRVLAEKLPSSQLRAVLLHELIHLRRGDVWMNCAQTFLQIAYWWHPLLWLANARIRRLREEAVDDAVMLALRDEPDLYAPTLLEVARLAFQRPRLSLGLVGIMESRSALRQRIERLVDFRAPRRAGLSFVSILGILLFIAVVVPMGSAPAQTSVTETPALAKPANTNLQMHVFGFKHPERLLHMSGVTSTNLSEVASNLFARSGVDWNFPGGKSIEYMSGGESSGLLFVRATGRDLDTIGSALKTLDTNPQSPQIHIKAYFIEIPKKSFDADTKELNQFTDILSEKNTKAIIQALRKRPGVNILAMPEVVTTSGRRTQLKATQVQMILTNWDHEETSTNVAIIAQTGKFEIGSVLNVVPRVLPDNRTINLSLVPSLNRFLGYDQPTNNDPFFYTKAGKKVHLPPTPLPVFSIGKTSTNLNIYDNQTVALKLNNELFEGGIEMDAEPEFFRKPRNSTIDLDKEVLVLVTATLIDDVGNRIHTKGDTDKIPPQPSS